LNARGDTPAGTCDEEAFQTSRGKRAPIAEIIPEILKNKYLPDCKSFKEDSALLMNIFGCYLEASTETIIMYPQMMDFYCICLT